MKNHIVFKFIAILLCAASLMGAVGSAVGIFAMTEMDLYNRSYQDAYDEMVESWVDGLVYNIGIRYASGALGGCNTQLVDDYYYSGGYYSMFDMSKVGYTLTDSEGNVLQEQVMDEPSVYNYTFPVGGRYIRLVQEMTEEEWNRMQEGANENAFTYSPEGHVLYDAVPSEGAYVYQLTVTWMDGSSEGIGSDDPLGHLYYDDGGWLNCEFFNYDFVERELPQIVTSIQFQDEDHNVLFEANDPEGVGEFYRDDAGNLMFRGNLVEMYAPEIEEETAEEMGARAIVTKRTPIWWMDGTDFEKSGTYYGKDHEVNIYATKVYDGVLYGCTTRGYLTDSAYHSDWVAMEALEITPYVASASDRGQRAVCNTRTQIWALDGAECYDTGMYYQKGQEIGILVLGTFDSGEWGMTELGWVRLADVTMPQSTPVAVDATEATETGDVVFAKKPANVYASPNNPEIIEMVAAGDQFTVLKQKTVDGKDWVLIELGWLLAEDVTFVEETPVTHEVTPEATAEVTTAPTEILTTDPTQETFEIEETVEETIFSTEVTQPVTAAEEVATPDIAAAPYQTDVSTEPTMAVGETMPYIAADDVEYTRYYNNDIGAWMMAEVVDEIIPDGYTINIQLAAGALAYQYEWELFSMLYELRNELPKILGVSLLVFVLLAVYLCCAAGKTPGTKEIRAGGLNCIPLDLYCCTAVVGVIGAVVLGFEGVRYLSQNSLQVAVWFALAVAYAASLLIVGFCFACAAQFKTPGGYWWRHSICGLLLRFVGKCFRLLVKIAEWLGVKWDSKLWPGLVKLVKGIFKVLAVILKQLWTWLLLLFGLLERGTNRLGKKLNRFFSMLPLTWQWLLVGFILVLWLFIAVDGRREGMLVVWFIAGLAAVLYGAHCFGSLLESAKRMSKGDLDEKVDDKLMTGAFKDFAGELNSLADVAVVAAQKQLKSERMKTELITNVSHDIKTPLTSIINYVDLLQKPHTAEDQEKYLEVLDRQSQRLKKLIDDLMEMSKASTGNLSVDITRVDAGEAVNQALGEFADKLDKASLFPVFRQPETPVYMMADGRLVWRVMSNLLSNAVKYALPGTRLYVDLQKLDSKVIISLKNISREELNVNADELLERFVRGDASRNTEGSGLGLNIAQSLMELQKGQLQILVDGDLFKVTLVFPGVE